MAKKKSAKKPPRFKPTRIADVQIALSLMANDRANCCFAREAPGKKQPETCQSGIGGVFWGRPGEPWPTTSDGRPLFPWVQISRADFPGWDGPFERMLLLTFFLDPEFDHFEAVSAYDQAPFVVRCYPRRARLEPMKRPRRGLSGHKWASLEWSAEYDYPLISRYFDVVTDEVYDQLEAEAEKYGFRHHSGIKVGGWPTSPQHNPYPGSCELQIDVTSNYMYADTGVAHLRAAGDCWHATFETC